MPQDCCIVSRAARLFRLRCTFMVSVVLSVVPCLVPITASQAQERIRTAAAELEIQEFRKPETLIRLGPFQEELTGYTGIDITDNSNIVHTGKISRVSIFEGFGLDTIWTLSHINQLEFNFGGRLREDFYGNGTSNVNFSIAPDSQLQFKFAVDDVQVRLYDNFSYTQDPTTNPVASNTTYLNSINNILGAEVKKDLNRAVFTLFGNYSYNSQSGANAQGQTNSSSSATRNTFRVGSNLGFRWTPTVLYGIETSISRTTGSSPVITGLRPGTTSPSANVNSLNIGPFIRGEISRLTDFDFGVGATLLDAKPSVPPTCYLSAVLRHEFNRNFQMILSGSHELIFTTGTDITEEYVFQAATQLNLTRFITFTANPNLLLGDSRIAPNQVNFQNGTIGGNFKEYAIGASLRWKPRRHLSATVSYDFRRRDAEVANGSYSQNRILFEISYVF
jgi:hypothetical protein